MREKREKRETGSTFNDRELRVSTVMGTLYKHYGSVFRMETLES